MLNPLNTSQTKTLFQLALGGYWLALFVATHVPIDTPPLPIEIDHVDKIYHFTAYAILAGLIATTWQFSSGILNGRHLRWVWLAVASYAAFDELTQPLVNRDCSFWDWVADVAGAGTALLAFIWLRKQFFSSTTDA